jgi:hypothetical protein
MKAAAMKAIMLLLVSLGGVHAQKKCKPKPATKNCPSYCTNLKKSKGGRFVDPIVTQTGYGKNGATFELSARLRDAAVSIYSLHGTSKGSLVMPPAYHAKKNPIVGAPDPLYKMDDDSFLTVGLRTVGKQLGASPKFPLWTSRKGFSSKDAAIFYMDPRKAPKVEKVLLAQLTVPVPCSRGWSAEMGLSGYTNAGKIWRDDDITWAWQKFSVPKKGCPVYFPSAVRSKGSNYVTPIVEQVAYGKNGATYQLSVKLKGQAASVYSLHGTDKGPLILPPAYQSTKSRWVGAPNPLYKQDDDSFLTVGMKYVNKREISTSPNLPKWDANTGVMSHNAAVFWMDPRKAPKTHSKVLLAQLTVKVPCSRKWSAAMGLSGYTTAGKIWRNNQIVFAWSKFSIPKKGCPVYSPSAVKSRGTALVTPKIEQVGYGKNGATFRLYVSLKGKARTVHSIHGTDKGHLMMPPAYQSKKSPAVGGPDPLFNQKDDSFLTIGLDVVNKKQIAVSPNFPDWTADTGLNTRNAAVFWMNPDKAPKFQAKKPILVAQVTVKVPCTNMWSARMGVSGRDNKGKVWRNDNVIFAWKGHQSMCKKPKATKNCPGYCSPFTQSKAGKYVTPVITQTGFGANGATFQLSVKLKGGAANVYGLHGTGDGPLILPPAYQSKKNSLIGAPDRLYKQDDDSFLTIGPKYVGKQISSTPNFPVWTARRGVYDKNSAIFWMNPRNGPKRSKNAILVAQVTVPVPCSKSWSAAMGFTGYKNGMKQTWRDDDIVFQWSKFKSSGKRCNADVEYKKGPGVINVEDLLVILSAFNKKCPQEVSCEVDIESKRSKGVITVEDLLVILSAFGSKC